MPERWVPLPQWGPGGTGATRDRAPAASSARVRGGIRWCPPTGASRAARKWVAMRRPAGSASCQDLAHALQQCETPSDTEPQGQQIANERHCKRHGRSRRHVAQESYANDDSCACRTWYCLRRRAECLGLMAPSLPNSGFNNIRSNRQSSGAPKWPIPRVTCSTPSAGASR